ncbi:MAG TPA: serine/threonine-protein kinase [Rhodanobacteraceae bacterium]|nr:serine/threonine-protein kinase [Rhodanobacteraceae bacterium]
MPRQSLDELFDAAQDIPPQRRTAWLDAVCAGDPLLRHELERLLAADAREQGVLESGPTLLADVMADATDTPQGFGSWRVLRRLGAGGMGEVWLAERDDAGFVQRAAIKQVAWPTPGLLQRFQRERQILARLEHPGVARLIDGGVDAAGCPYLAMEYVKGERIDAWVRARALGVRATVRLLLQVCEAVQFAHRNLVVHSDIKPSNILITDEGAPRLLDFGIARVLSGDDAEATRTATRLMTPDYAAPEWIGGGPVTTAVDVYALGVLAYELLSGTKPYRLDRGGDVARQLADRLTEPPSAALARDIPDRRARRRVLRGDLDRIVQTAMARDPARRYATVEALAQDLRAWLDGRAVAARGDQAWYRLRKFVARNRVAVGATALVVVTLILATAFSLRQAYVANQQAGRAQRQAARADAVRRFLDNTFAQMDPAANRGETVGMRDLLERSEARLAKAADMPLSVRVDLTTLVGKLYWNLADNTSSERVLKSAVALGGHGGVSDEARARALLALATVEQDRSDNESAWRHATMAHTLASRAREPDRELVEASQRLVTSMSIAHEGAVHAEPALRELLAADRARYGESEPVVNDLIMLGHALDVMARYEEAEASLSEAVAMARRLNGTYASYLGLALDFLGTVRVHRGDYAGASQAFVESGRITGMLWGVDNVRTSITREQVLEVAILEGRFEESLPAVMAVRDEAVTMRKARPDHYAASWKLLGDTYSGLGRFREAETAYHMGLTLWSEVPQGNQSAGMAETLSALSSVLKWQGRLPEAEKAVLAAIDIDRRAVPPGMPSSASGPWLGRDLSALAGIIGLEGRHDEALARARAAVASLPHNPGGESPHSALVQARLANALLAHGEADAALVQASEALAIADRVLPPDNWQRAPLWLARGRVELAMAQPAAAEAALRRALALCGPLHPGHDPRVLEVKVALIRALAMQGKVADAASLRAEVEPALSASSSSYLAALRERLPAR